MKIMVYGTGGVGGYFGGHLAASGCDVSFIARGKHLDALHKYGLKIDSVHSPLNLTNVKVAASPDDLPPPDIVLLCTKLWDVAQAAEHIKPVLQEHSVVIPFQNGVESPVILQRVLGKQHVLGGIAYISAAITAPGMLSHVGARGRLRIGSFIPELHSLAHAFVDLCHSASINAELVDDIHSALWEKFVFLSSIAGVCCLARQPAGVVRSDPELRATLENALQEAYSVGLAEQAHLPEQFIQQLMAVIDELPEAMQPSMLHDLLSGHRLEAAWLCGAVAHMAQRHDLPAPVNATIYAALKPYLQGKPH